MRKKSLFVALGLIWIVLVWRPFESGSVVDFPEAPAQPYGDDHQHAQSPVVAEVGISDVRRTLASDSTMLDPRPPSHDSSRKLTLLSREDHLPVEAAEVWYVAESYPEPRYYRPWAFPWKYDDPEEWLRHVGTRADDPDGTVILPASAQPLYVQARKGDLWGLQVIAPEEGDATMVLDLERSVCARMIGPDGNIARDVDLALRAKTNSNTDNSLVLFLGRPDLRSGDVEVPHVDWLLDPDRSGVTAHEYFLEPRILGVRDRRHAIDPEWIPRNRVDLEVPAYGSLVVEAETTDGRPYGFPFRASMRGYWPAVLGEDRSQQCEAGGVLLFCPISADRAIEARVSIPDGTSVTLEREPLREHRRRVTLTARFPPSRPAPCIVGRVTSSMGVALAGRTVEFHLADTEHFGNDISEVVTLDEMGSFEVFLDPIVHSTPYQALRILERRDGVTPPFAEASVPIPFPLPVEPLDVGLIALKDYVVVASGIVLCHDGAPIANAAVQAGNRRIEPYEHTRSFLTPLPKGEVRVNGTTDSDGRFCLYSPVPFSGWVEVWRECYSVRQERAFEFGVTELEFRFRSPE